MTHLTIESNLRDFLQKCIRIQVDAKTIKEGKLVLFNLKEYYLILVLKIKNRRRTYEMPYPFVNYLKDGNSLVFDYRLAHIHKNEPMLLKHGIFHGSKKSKYYDKIVTISTL